jgi:hypothetical protein
MNGSETLPSSRLLWAVEALEMEPRVISIELPGMREPGEDAVVEVAEIVLPRASVVVKSRCFASPIVECNGGLATPPG